MKKRLLIVMEAIQVNGAVKGWLGYLDAISRDDWDVDVFVFDPDCHDGISLPHDVDDLPSQKFKTLGKGNAVVRQLRFNLMYLWERLLIRYAARYWVCNQEQMRIGKGLEGIFLPNIAKAPSANYAIAHVSRDILLSVGGMSYEPNYQGVDWFVTNAWPLIRVKHPAMRYRIVGGGLSEKLRVRWSQVTGVEVVGFADDLEKEYENAALVIAPIFSGAGTCIKVIEAALHGRHVLAAPFAARGLTEEDRQQMGVTICREVKAFCVATEKWLEMTDEKIVEAETAFAQTAQAQFSLDGFCRIVRDTFKNET